MRAWRYSEAFGRRLAAAFATPFARAQAGTALITLWENPWDSTDPGHELELSWTELFAALAAPVPYRGRFRHPVWAPAIFSPRIRAIGNVRAGTALVLTFEHCTRLTPDTTRAALDPWHDYSGFAYSAVRPSERRTDLRVVLPLARWISEAEHRRLRAWARERCSTPFASAPLGLAAAYPLPSAWAGGPFLACELPGTRALDPSLP